MAAGFVSAVISANFQNHLMILGAVFGVVIVLCLMLFEGIRAPFRIAAFILACSASFPLSILGAMVFGIRTPQTMHISLLDLFVGGGIGAFLVLLSGILLFGPAGMRGESLGLAFLCSFCGSILGLLGGELNLALGHLQRGDSGSYFGSWVFIVWQSGVALTLGVLLARGKRRWEPTRGTPPK
jgi:hypothetical protein